MLEGARGVSATVVHSAGINKWGLASWKSGPLGGIPSPLRRQVLKSFTDLMKVHFLARNACAFFL